MMPDTRPAADPTPRTLEQMYRELKGLEDKINLRFDGSSEAVRLLQEISNRQPTTEAVAGDLKALKELMETKFLASKDLTTAIFEGNKTALEAALLTRKEGSDKIEQSFTKQFDNIQDIIRTNTKASDDKTDDLKARLSTIEGRAIALAGFGALIGGAAVALIMRAFT